MRASQPGSQPAGQEGKKEAELERLFAQYVDRLNGGEKLEAKAILQENPELGKELLEYLEGFIGAGTKPAASGALGTLGDYRLLRQLGRGGMGIVYEAYQASMDRRVALKVLPVGAANDAKAFTRFVREAQVAGRLHHPNIVPVYHLGVEGGAPYFAMEYIPGETLAEVLKRFRAASGGLLADDSSQVLSSISRLFQSGAAREAVAESPLLGEKTGSEEAASGPSLLRSPRGLEADEVNLQYCLNVARAFIGVGEALQYAHGKGIIHRDLKPSNLMLDREGELRILDFGLAHLEGQESLTRSGDLVGTPLYMSPEQALARRVPLDHRTDIYSLGATLYELLTWRPPFKGRDHRETLNQIAFKEPKALRRLNPRIPKDLETVVLKCLRKDPEERYGTAEALAQDLRRLVRGDPVEARPQPAVVKLLRRALRKKGQLAAVMAALLLILATGLLVRGHFQELQERNANLYEEKILHAVMNLELIQQGGEGQSAMAIKRRRGKSQEEKISHPHAFKAEIEMPASPWGELAESVISGQENIAALFPQRPEAYYHRARALKIVGKEDEAKKALERALRCDPEFMPALILLETILEKGAGNHSSNLARDTKKAIPGRGKQAAWAEAWLKAHQAMVERRWTDAAEAYGKLMDLEDAKGENYLGLSLEIRLGRGRARLSAKDYDGALEDFGAARALWPDLVEPALLLGKTYFLKGDKERAENLFKDFHLRARFPDEASLSVAALYRDLGAHEKGLVWAEQAESSSRREHQRAQLLLDLDQVEEAARAAKKALELNPQDPLAHLAMGRVFRKLGENSQALEEFERAAALDSNNAQAHFELAWSLHDAKRMAAALSSYLKGLKLDPYSSRGHNNLGNFYASQGKLPQAQEEYRKAIELDPDNTVPLGNLGRTYTELGDFESSIRTFLTTLKKDPDLEGELIEALQKLAASARENEGNGSAQKGLEYSLEALKLTGRKNPEILAIVADFQALSRNYQEAVTLLDEALQLPGANPQLMEQLKKYSPMLLPDMVSYLSIDAALEGLKPGSVEEKRLEENYLPLAARDNREALLHYLRGRILERGGKQRQSIPCFLEAVALDPTRREPFFRLVSSLRSAGDPQKAEWWLRQGANKKLSQSEDFWNLWIGVSLAVLRRSPKETLESIPLETAADQAGAPITELRWSLEQLAAKGFNDIPEEVFRTEPYPSLSSRLYAFTLRRLHPGIWERLQEEKFQSDEVVSQEVMDLPVIGGGKGGGFFKDIPKPGALLTGLIATFSYWRNGLAVGSLQPIFFTPAGRLDGSIHGVPNREKITAFAKPGYAMGGLLAEGSDVFSGFRVIFMKIRGDRLDSKDSYLSPWYGGRGWERKKLGGSGEPVIGIAGRAGLLLDSFGLVAAPPLLSDFGWADRILSAPQVLVPEGAEWRFFRGKREPSQALEWTEPSFDDRSWERGASGFGYWHEHLNLSTVLTDMKGNYTTLYLRHLLDLPEPSRFRSFRISVNADDGCIVYLNGAEVGRVCAGESGERMSFDGVATGGWSVEWSEFPLDPKLFRPGKNVVAIQALNQEKESSGFFVSTRLVGDLFPSPESDRERLEKFQKHFKGVGAISLAYFEGRILQRGRLHSEALAKFEEVLKRDRSRPEPWLRLAESLRAAGDPARAEVRLREALEADIQGSEMLWDLWFIISAVDLKRNAAEILKSFPAQAQGGGEGRGPDLRWLLEQLCSNGAIRIRCGEEEYRGREGKVWGRDRFFNSAFPSIDDLNAAVQKPSFGEIHGTEDGPLFLSERSFSEGDLKPHGYRVPLIPGRYQVGLYFAEVAHQEPGHRRFAVLLEGKPCLENYEPLQAGFATAEVKSFEVSVEDGFLDLEFLREIGDPMISAIEVQKTGER
ncbi:MAG: tetratricopeptide repeat protein [Planctomycetes bacterium]|nr:tetratricopeptide repeat protein [Planctomycetota bacterium]